MNKFRASYTVLNMWSSGNWEEAVKYYFKLEQFTSRAMADGKDFHDSWEKHIKETSTLPEVFGGAKLVNPQTELKLVVQMDEWLELVGKIDCLEAPTIHEFKTGKSSSESYASSWQIGVYGVLCAMSGIKIDRGIVHHFDQYKKTYDWSQVWITKDVIKDSAEWIVTHASEMHSYLVENNLYERFGKK